MAVGAVADEAGKFKIALPAHFTETPEFDHWRWVDFWYPLEHVVIFKRGVYTSALSHLAKYARQVAGAQAIPQPAIELRPRSRRPQRRGPRRGPEAAVHGRDESGAG